MGMIGVSFYSDYNKCVAHSFEDWHVLYDGNHIDYPTPRRITVDVALRNGLLDVTPDLTGGKIFYENRSITLDFVVVDNPLPWPDLYSKIAGDIHGKSMYLIFDTDPYYYWYAYSCTIKTPSSEEDVGKFSIECDCYPYKYAKELTKKVVEVPSYGYVEDFVLTNGREEIIPTIVVTGINGTPGTIDVVLNGDLDHTVGIEPGTNYLESLTMKEGKNTFSFLNLTNPVAATIDISFRKGEL